MRTLKSKHPPEVQHTPKKPQFQKSPRNGVQQVQHDPPPVPSTIPQARTLPSSICSNTAHTNIGTTSQAAMAYSLPTTRQYISKPITPYKSQHPPHPAPIHTPTPTLPYPFLASSTLSHLVQPIPSLLLTTTSTMPSSLPATTYPLPLSTCHVSSTVHASSSTDHSNTVKYSHPTSHLPSNLYSTSPLPTSIIPPSLPLPIVLISRP